MKILLVNSNPVVSRLTALSARKESVELDEIKNISELKNSDYNIVFVDLESYSKELSTILKNSNIKKRVLFHTQDDENKAEIFNFDILKPFLPSEVSAIIRETKIEIDNEEHSTSTISREKSQEQYMNLNELIATKKDDLEPINLIDDKVEEIKEEVTEIVKEEETIKVEEEITEIVKEEETVKVEEEITEIAKEEETIKEEVVKDSKDNFDLALEEISPLTTPKATTKEADIEKFVIKESIIEEKITTKEPTPKVDIDNNELFELDSDDKDSDSDSNIELFTLDVDDTKDEKTKDSLLDFDLESKDEIDFESDNSTKILDKDEISNIKNLLNEESKTDEEMTLEEVMTTTAPLEVKEIKKEKKKKKKKLKQSKEKGDISAKVLADTLGAMPIDDLRRLLLGTKIHITIEFPNEL